MQSTLIDIFRTVFSFQGRYLYPSYFVKSKLWKDVASNIKKAVSQILQNVQEIFTVKKIISVQTFVINLYSHIQLLFKWNIQCASERQIPENIISKSVHMP